MTRLSTKLIVALSLLAIVFAIGAPMDILFADNVPANQNLCIFEPSNNQNLLNSGTNGTCPRPHKDGRFWDQGEGKFCYLVSILNSNIYSGVNDSDNQFYKSFMECLENYGVNICHIGREGVAPGSFEDEIIKGCKMLKMKEIGEPVGLDEYKLRKPWWDWQTETHSIIDLCAKIKKQYRMGAELGLRWDLWPAVELIPYPYKALPFLKMADTAFSQHPTLIIQIPTIS